MASTEAKINGPQSPPQDLDGAGARIAALEQELEDARQTSTSRIQRLESEKADMQNELAALRRKLPDKKPEPVGRIAIPARSGATSQASRKPPAKPAVNGIQSQETARLRQELTQLREKHRAEVERLQLQSVCLGFEIMALQDASAAHETAMAALKAEHAALITTADAHISMLTERAEYERAESERAESERETFRKLNEHQEGEGNPSMHSQQQQQRADTVPIPPDDLQGVEDAQPVQVVESAGGPTEKAVLSTYRTHMKAFRGSGKPPRLCELKPVLDRRRDLRMYLEVDPQLSSYARRALDISARSIQMPRGQYLFFNPTHVWDAGLSAWTTAPRDDADTTTTWADTSVTSGDETKEVFATHGAHRLYVGSFRCHDLSGVFPEGVGVPKSISSRAVRDAALSVRPPSSNNYESETLIQRRWPDGMKVHATALEFVGFDSGLYDSLRARFVAEDGQGLGATFGDTEEIEKGIETAEESQVVEKKVEVENVKEEGEKGEGKEGEREKEKEPEKPGEDEDEAYSGWGLRASRWAV